MKWLRNRIIPKNREYVDSFLAKNGLAHNDTKGILQICKGLSLNDSYWIVENEDEKFEDYNLYEHDFLKVLSLITYTGYGSSPAKGFTSSPEFTTAGMLRKGWRRAPVFKSILLSVLSGTFAAFVFCREDYFL